MNKTLKWTLIFAGVGVAIIGGRIVYKRVIFPKVANKEQQVKKIITSGNSRANAKDLMTLDDAFIKAWVEAIVANKPTFVIGGSTISTAGGKIKQ